MDTSPLPVPLSIAQAADYAHVSARTIRRWIASGRLRADRAGQVCMINRIDLECAVEHGSRVAVDAAPIRGPRVAMSAPMFVELGQRLATQAAELAALRLERDTLAERLRSIADHNDTAARSLSLMPETFVQAGKRITGQMMKLTTGVT